PQNLLLRTEECFHSLDNLLARYLDLRKGKILTQAYARLTGWALSFRGNREGLIVDNILFARETACKEQGSNDEKFSAARVSSRGVDACEGVSLDNRAEAKVAWSEDRETWRDSDTRCTGC
ncbi:MAG: hypothetical protein DRQ06_00420, partial [Candidatus Hydrothermota bacterium]